MSDPLEITSLTLAGLAHRCSEETHLFFRRLEYDPRYCYELFRRAIVDADQDAHACLYRQYLPLVAGWVERHPAFRTTSEDTDYFVNRAFEKLWHAITPVRFTRFDDLKSLLRYLKMCTNSAIVDFNRRSELALIDDGSDSDELRVAPAPGDIEEDTIARVDRSQFWRLIVERLNNDKERAVIYASFVLGMKPAELLESQPQLFDDIKDVYRTKQNVLERLRRDTQLASKLVDAA
ncbi:MAG: sigma-70 family RNA polymerase sigma factor [Anaerolineae bacterium]|nr:sigma-70 family RNA polymerase sigma factor [Anaerolineae bacterium]